MSLLAFLLFSLLFALTLLFISFSALLTFLKTGVPPVSTKLAGLASILRQCQISSADTFYDLGSGDGRVVFFAESLTGARAVGFELAFWSYIFSCLKKKLKGSKARFVKSNFFERDWSEATVIYAYLYPHLMSRVEEKFRTECRRGSLAIIRDFPFPNFQPRQIFKSNGVHKIYVYERI